jgi:plasmid replication initiation protein
LVFNKLIENAWGPKLGQPNVWFEVRTADLKDAYDRNDRLEETIERLMKTVVVAVDSEGQWETRTALLSSNKLELSVNDGVFRYKLTEELALLVKDSTIFAKLDLEVMRSFRSKFAFGLYEAIARRVRLKHKFLEELSIEQLRDILGVDEGKLLPFKNLNAKAIKPALEEVNAITPYEVSIVPKKSGRKVVAFLMGWSLKNEDGLKEAYSELNRHSSGRVPRSSGNVDDLKQ